jgi:hypothetical protein
LLRHSFCYLIPSQVLQHTPFLVKHGQGEESWGKLVQVLSQNAQFAVGVSAKKAREKFNEYYREFKSTQATKKASTGGDDEVVTEVDSLLQDIVDLKDDDDDKKKQEKEGGAEKEKNLVAAGEELRKQAVGELRQRRDGKEAKESKPSASVAEGIVEFLKTRADQRNQEFEIQKRKLEFAEKELEFKMQEAEKRAKRENEERDERNMMFKALLESKK